MEITDLSSVDDVAILELRYDVEDSPSIAQGLGFKDMVTVEEPVTVCCTVGEPFWDW